jgi:hypothetical protein
MREILYLAMLALHAAHVAEESRGRFWVHERLGRRRFLIVNGLLFVPPVVFFRAGLCRGRPWACRGAQAYAALMALNGVAHAAVLALTRRYVGGAAGAVTGLGLAVLGPLLLRALRVQRAAVTATGNARSAWESARWTGGAGGADRRQPAVGGW